METEQLDNGVLTIRCVLHSRPEDVRSTLEQVRKSLVAQRFPVPDHAMWELVVAEALNNIVEHAYKDRTDGEIQVTLEFAKAQMRARIVDFGNPMPDEKAPPGRAANLNVPKDDLPEGGFGWFLIHSLTQDLVYARKEDANHLLLNMTFHNV